VRELHLPHLAQLLGQLALVDRDDGEPDTLSPPHERALGAAAGWRAADGCLPFAAHAARADGVHAGTQAWGWVTPVHWHVAHDHVRMTDPAALALTPDESRAAFDAVRDLFESVGWRLEWASTLRWYAAHDSLDGLPCASLDRVIGGRVEHWMRSDTHPASPAAAIRRLQSEVQMLLYPHPLNEAREQRGLWPLNSFWLSGCGRLQDGNMDGVTVADALRAPALAQDWTAWAQAWRVLDDGPVAQWLLAARRGQPVRLTLCGERNAHRYDRTARPWWRRMIERWQMPALHDTLLAL
jgi:hypothetical protein